LGSPEPFSRKGFWPPEAKVGGGFWLDSIIDSNWKLRYKHTLKEAAETWQQCCLDRG